MTLADKQMDVNVRSALVQNPTGREFRVTFSLWGYESDQLQRIMTRHLPDWAKLFAVKNSEYGSGEASSGTALGVKGQFADIWRKIGKLKTAVWDDNEDRLVSEGVDEILQDLIGHCFLALDLRAQERFKRDSDRLSAAAVGDLFTSLSYSMDDGRTLFSGQQVAFSHHLGRGGVYNIVGFDTRRSQGMIACISDSDNVNSWTNPDWLVDAVYDKKIDNEESNRLLDRAAKNKCLTCGEDLSVCIHGKSLA